jgi:hypothetical protein
VRSQPVLRVVPWLVALLVLAASCASNERATPASYAPSLTALAVGPMPVQSTVVVAPQPTMPAPVDTASPTSTSTIAPVLDRGVLAGISTTSVPRDVIVPTSAASLNEAGNPINGSRGSGRPLPEDLDCVTDMTRACLLGRLDMLGFDVTSGSIDDRERRLERATAVVQLDAGLARTGVLDDDLLAYLGVATESRHEARADETRQIGTSAMGRPIMAMRYGDGPRTVLVVGQTHGDEEGGLRILLRVQSLPIPDDITLWVIPTMNPDGLAADARFLANGADPNRSSPSQLEQLAVHDFALETKPSLTVWYHQNYGWVGASGASVTPAQQYQQLTGLGTLKHSGNCATRGFVWCPIDDALGSSSILVELPDVLTPADVQKHARSLLAVASGDVS